MVFFRQRLGIQHPGDKSSIPIPNFINTSGQRTEGAFAPRQQGNSLISTRTRGHPQQNASRRSRTNNDLGREKLSRPQSNLSPRQAEHRSRQLVKKVCGQLVGVSSSYIRPDCQTLAIPTGGSICYPKECQAREIVLTPSISTGR